MSFEWREVSVEEVIEINPTYNLKKGTLAKKVAMENLIPFTKTIGQYQVEEFKGGAKFKNGDTLLARITPSLENGKTAFVNLLENNEIGFGSTEFIVLRGKEGKTENEFVYYLSISPEFRSIAIKSMTGTSGRQRAQVDAIGKWKFMLPSLQEQKEIASLLSSLDDKIELNNAINKNLEEMAQALYKRWFVEFEFPNENGEPYKSSGGEFEESELGLIPRGWRVSRLYEIADILMGQSPKSEYYNEFGEGMPFHQGVSNYGYRFPMHKTYCTQALRVAKKGSILVSVRAPVGRLNIADRDLIIGRGLGAINSKNNCNSFMYYLLKRIFAVEDQHGSGTIFNSVTKKELEELVVINPSLEIMQQFEVIVSNLDEQLLNLYKEITNLSQVRDTLLPKLMSGEIRVPVEQP